MNWFRRFFFFHSPALMTSSFTFRLSARVSGRFWLLIISLILNVFTPAVEAQRSPTGIHTSIDDVVFSFCFSPDSRTFAIARGAMDPVYRFGRIELWDTGSGKLRHVIKGFEGPVMSVSFSPDGKTLISGSIEFRPLKLQQKIDSREGVSFAEVRWWNSETGELKHRVTLSKDGSHLIRAIHSPIGEHLAVIHFFGHSFFSPRWSFSPGGFSEASYGNSFLQTQIRMLDAHTGEPGPKLDAGQPGPVIFSPDGNLLAVANTKAVRLLNSQTGEVIHKFKDFRGTVAAIAISPGSRILAVASTRYEEHEASGNLVKIFGISEIRLFDIATGAITLTLKDIGAVNGLSFSPDGRILVFGGMLPVDEGGSAGIKLYDFRTSKTTNLPTGEDYKEQVGPITISRDGRLLAFRAGAGTVKLLNTQTGIVTQTLDEDSAGDIERPASRFELFVTRVMAVAFSADGTMVTGESDQGEIKTWDARTGAVKHGLSQNQHEPSIVAASMDGTSFAEVTGGELLFWHANTETKSRVSLADADITALALSGDGRMLAVASRRKVTLLSPAGAVERELAPHEGVINRVVFSRDGGRLAGADQFGNTSIWDVETGRLNKKLVTQSEITSLAFSANGETLATAATDKSISIWNVQTGLAQEKLQKHSHTINALAFSPDGQWLASGSDDRTIVLWEVAKGKSKRTFKGHDQSVTSLAFSPDGRLLASGTGNASVVMWEVDSGKLNRVLK